MVYVVHLILFHLILICTVCVFSSRLSAQQSTFGLEPRKSITQYIHQVWQTEQGLPQNSAYSLCQTENGYIWIGTAEGLVRFDGVRFTTFTKNSTPALQSNWISSFAEHSDGSLYIGTRAGVVCLYKGIFTNLNSRLGIPESIVRALFLDRTGALWIATNGEGVFCVPPKALRQARIKADSTHPYSPADSLKIHHYTIAQGLTSNTVLSLLQTPNDGAIWLGTQGNGLNRIYSGKVDIPQGQGELAKVSVRALLLDRDNQTNSRAKAQTMWIGAQNGLYSYINGSFAPVAAKNTLPTNSIQEKSIQTKSVRTKGIQTLLQDRHGTLWIGTFGGGLYRLRDSMYEGFTSAHGLSNDIIQSLLQDHEGSLWIGTFGGGLNRLHNGTFTKYTEQHGLSNKYVNSVLCGTDGKVWAATNGGGLNVLEQGMFRRYGLEKGLKANIIASLMFDRDRFWVGSGEGLYGLPRNGDKGVDSRTVHYTHREGLSHNSVWTVLSDSLLADGVGKKKWAVWCGTQDGLNYIRDGVIKKYTTAQGLSNNVILCLLHGKMPSQNAVGERGLWIGTQKGLNFMRNDTIRQFTRRDGLSSNYIWSLLQDDDGTLWIGTTNGLHRFKNGVFTACTSRDGLFDDIVFSIMDDGAGWLWMSCNRGVYRVRKADVNAFADGTLLKVVCENFGAADGMMSAECNGGSPPVSKDANGCLWYPTIAGVVMVNPRLIVRNELPPKVLVESLKADSTEWSLPLSESNASAQTILTMPVGADKLELRYTACSFRVPERVRFRYMLEGYDKSWTQAGVRRVAYYNNLPHGKTYRFRVQASNDSGVWNETDASVEFFVPLFFYETWWFLSACVCAGIGILSLLVRSRLRRVQNRAKFLERAVEERTQELADANVELQAQNQQLELLNYEKIELLNIVSHDLKNPLGAVRGMAELLHLGFISEQEAPSVSEQIINISDRMLDLVKKLLEVNSLEAGAREFVWREFDCLPVIQTTVAQYQTSASQKGIIIHVQHEDATTIIGDEQAFMQVMDNLISNAVKYSPHGKNVWIRLKSEGGNMKQEEAVISSLIPLSVAFNTSPFLRVEIQDEGPGISEEDMKKLFGKFARLSAQPTGGEHSTGLGLSIVKKMVEAMNGRVWCESEVGDGLPTGATFIVELPRA